MFHSLGISFFVGFYTIFLYVLFKLFSFPIYKNVQILYFAGIDSQNDLDYYFYYKSIIKSLLIKIAFFFIIPTYYINQPQIEYYISYWINVVVSIVYYTILAWEMIWLYFFTTFFAATFVVLYFFICMPVFLFIFSFLKIFNIFVQLNNGVIFFTSLLKLRLSIYFNLLIFSVFSFFNYSLVVTWGFFFYTKILEILLPIWSVIIKVQTLC